MRILQLCFRVPYPPHDGGAIAMYNITKGLNKAGHEVTVLAFNTPKHYQKEDVINDIADLHAVFIETKISPIKAFFNLFKCLPYNIERFISKQFVDELIGLLQREKFDVIHFEGMYVAWYVEIVRKYSTSPLVLRTHNLEFLIWKRLADNEKNILKRWYMRNLSAKLKKFELERFEKFDAIASISKEDAKIMKALNVQTRIENIPPGTEINIPINSKIPKSKSMFILSALEWMPNLEGLNWFLNNVWKKVSEKIPEIELHIAGKKTPESIKKLKLKNVFIHGFVPDAVEFMFNYDLMLVPLLSGSGVRIKIIEGMACRKCILTSTVGAEGINYTDGQNILIRDTSDEWVNTIVDYFSKFDNKYTEIGSNAGKLIQDQYCNDNIIEKLVELYKSLKV